MAMFPNATKGYMPYVHGKSQTQLKNKRSKPHHVNGGKLVKMENRKHAALGFQKMYQITLKDKKGQIHKCIVKTDGTKSLPELCESRLNVVATHSSMPNLGTATTIYSNPSKQRKVLSEKIEALNSLHDHSENYSASLDLRNCGKKEGIFSAFVRIIKEKIGKSEKEASGNCKHKSNGKSKRKPRDLSQRKRQRTVSAMSNLDPIQESPNEHEYECDDDADSYTHFSSSCSSDSDSSSVASSISCNIEPIDIKS